MPVTCGSGERGDAENDAVLALAPEPLEIELEPDQEHQVEQPHGAEQLHHVVARQQAETAGPDHRADDDEADDARHAGPLEQERDDEEHRRDQCEVEHRLGDGQT